VIVEPGSSTPAFPRVPSSAWNSGGLEGLFSGGPLNIDLPALIVGAVLLAGLYATMSYGLALVYGVMKIVNLAHAGVMMWEHMRLFSASSGWG